MRLIVAISGVDRTQANELVAQLRAAGHDVLVVDPARKDFDWQLYIDDEVDGADAVISLVNEQDVDPLIARALERAQALAKPQLPVTIGSAAGTDADAPTLTFADIVSATTMVVNFTDAVRHQHQAAEQQLEAAAEKREAPDEPSADEPKVDASRQPEGDTARRPATSAAPSETIWRAIADRQSGVATSAVVISSLPVQIPIGPDPAQAPLARAQDVGGSQSSFPIALFYIAAGLISGALGFYYRETLLEWVGKILTGLSLNATPPLAHGQKDEGKEVDDVRTGVFAQKVARPGDRIQIQFYLYIDEIRDRMDAIAKDVDESAKRVGAETTLLEGLPRGAIVEIELESMSMDDLDRRHLIVETTPRHVRWVPPYAGDSFSVLVPEYAKPVKRTLMRFTITLGGLAIGRADFFLEIAPAGSPVSEVPDVIAYSWRQYKDRFVSYARSDADEVYKRLDVLRSEGLQLFVDRTSIPRGADWEAELKNAILRCDCFCLFWSSAAEKSGWVRKEYNMFDVRDRTGAGQGIPPPGFKLYEIDDPSPRPWPELRRREFKNVRWHDAGSDDGPAVRTTDEPTRGVPEAQLGVAVKGTGNTGAGRIEPPGTGPYVTSRGREVLRVAVGIDEETFLYRKPLGDFQDLAIAPRMIILPAGTFAMGSPSEEEGRHKSEGPQRAVTIERAFAMSECAVTFAEWDQALDSGLGAYLSRGGVPRPSGGHGGLPVVNVTWRAARAYCSWLSSKTRKDYRLPTEAEWEYACRAGTSSPFCWSSLSPERANYNGAYTIASGGTGENRAGPLEARGLKVNPWGLYNMHGNVWEWVEDYYHETYDGAPMDGSAWLDPRSEFRVVRGGCFKSGPYQLRSARRGRCPNRPRDAFAVGFRVARSV